MPSDRNRGALVPVIEQGVDAAESSSQSVSDEFSQRNQKRTGLQDDYGLTGSCTIGSGGGGSFGSCARTLSHTSSLVSVNRNRTGSH